jgi:coproporphyrinogen III oxidase-like Fe-S oxidoreductase
MENTPFFENMPPDLPDDDRQAELYSFAVDTLHADGFRQYEISNFARPGFESRHNLKYWNCEDYIGLGPAAHSSIDGRRYSFPPDISSFIRDFSVPQSDSKSLLTIEGEVDSEDYIMMRLRTTTGLDIKLLRERFGIVLGKKVISLIEQYGAAEMANYDGHILSLTKKGLLVSNSIIVSILDAIEAERSGGFY